MIPMTRSRRRKLTRKACSNRTAIARAAVPIASVLLATEVRPAYAQEAPPGANAIEPATGGLEIVVTAQKRTENLQDVPISVEVFDTQKVEQLNITNIDDYVKFAPGIAYSRSGVQGGNGEPGKSSRSERIRLHCSEQLFDTRITVTRRPNDLRQTTKFETAGANAWACYSSLVASEGAT
jgi:hypothetical protein